MKLTFNHYHSSPGEKFLILLVPKQCLSKQILNKLRNDITKQLAKFDQDIKDLHSKYIKAWKGMTTFLKAFRPREMNCFLEFPLLELVQSDTCSWSFLEFAWMCMCLWVATMWSLRGQLHVNKKPRNSSSSIWCKCESHNLKLSYTRPVSNVRSSFFRSTLATVILKGGSVFLPESQVAIMNWGHPHSDGTERHQALTVAVCSKTWKGRHPQSDASQPDS